MKKFVVAVLIFCVAFTALHAQHAGEWGAGGRLGPVFGFHSPSAFLKNEFGSGDSLINFNFAAFLNYAFVDRLSVQGELNFMISQGMKWSMWGWTAEGTYSSLDIPILIKYAFIDDPLRVGILGGLHLSFPLGKVKFSYSEGGYTETQEFDSEGISFGLTAGGFLGYPLGPGRLIGDLRFIFDLATVRMKFPGSSSEDTLTRRGLAIGVGYEFSF